MTSLVAGALCVLSGAAIWLYSGTFPVLEEGHPGPSLFPRLIAVGLAAAGVVLLAGALRERSRRIPRPAKAQLLRFGAGVAVAAAYPAVQAVAGTLPALSLSCLAVALVLGLRLRTAVITAVACGILIFALFNGLLRVPL